MSSYVLFKSCIKKNKQANMYLSTHTENMQLQNNIIFGLPLYKVKLLFFEK